MAPLQTRSAVLVDEHPVWLDALESVLRMAGVEVVGKTNTAEDAIALIAETKADLLVTDLGLRGGVVGVGHVRETASQFPNVRIIVVSAHDDSSSVEEAFSSGADAFVSKTADGDDVAAAVRQVFDRSFFLSPSGESRRRNKRESDHLPGLTRREADVLSFVAEGYSNAQVARALWVTEQTVKFHLSNIYRKLGVANRTQATHWALINWGPAPTNR